MGTLLHLAVLRLAFDMMVERGFVPMTKPLLVRDEAMTGTGYFPIGKEQAYAMSNDHPPTFLVGTAEVSLTAYHMNETLDERTLPRKYVALSSCFRREAGTHGTDTAGLYRVHQFDKVEQVVICRNDVQESKRWHQSILEHAEAVLQRLNLPYRVVSVCTGELGQGQAAKFDIETWMPSRASYEETHSASRFYEFQARRLKMKYRDEQRHAFVPHPEQHGHSQPAHPYSHFGDSPESRWLHHDSAGAAPVRRRPGADWTDCGWLAAVNQWFFSRPLTAGS
jgi:seryl-tRNA synthetase